MSLRVEVILRVTDPQSPSDGRALAESVRVSLTHVQPESLPDAEGFREEMRAVTILLEQLIRDGRGDMADQIAAFAQRAMNDPDVQ